MLNLLRHMRMAANHRIGARIDHQAGQLALARTGKRLVFPAPVHHWNHQISPIDGARFFDVGHHLLVFAPGDAGRVVIGLKTARHEFAVAQQRNAQPLALDDQRGMRLRQIMAAAEIPQAGRIQQPQHLRKGRTAKVTRMVVGQRQRIEVPPQNRQGARMGAESEVFLARLPGRGDDALQIAKANIGLPKNSGPVGKRVLPARNHLAHRAVEHDVARKHQADRAGCRGSRRQRAPDQAQGRQPPAQTGLHGVTPATPATPATPSSVQR